MRTSHGRDREASASPAEINSKVVDRVKKRAYPLIQPNIKVPQLREKGYAREKIYVTRGGKHSQR